MTASRISREGRRMRPRLSRLAGSSRSGAGSRPGSLGWPEITWWAFTWKRKPGGVRSAQFSTVSIVGSA